MATRSGYEYRPAGLLKCDRGKTAAKDKRRVYRYGKWSDLCRRCELQVDLGKQHPRGGLLADVSGLALVDRRRDHRHRYPDELQTRERFDSGCPVASSDV